MRSTKQTTPNTPFLDGISVKDIKRHEQEQQFERLIRAARHDEAYRIVGIIEMYQGMLGQTSGEKTASHILDHVIRTITHNLWKPRSSSLPIDMDT